VWVATSSRLRHSCEHNSSGPRRGVGGGELDVPNFDFATNTLAVPAWAAGAIVAVFVVIAVLALIRSGSGLAGAVLRVAAAFFALAAVGLVLEQGALRERSAERRALDQRAADLDARAVLPGSALGCLNAVAGDAVETACEKAVFATPQSVAAAVSYVSARLALLADAVDFARRGGGYESALAALRLPIETDRFGIVAHVLSVRDSCTPLLCDTYVLLHDPDRVQANLREQLFARYVDRYAAEWSRAQTPVAEAPGNTFTTASAPPAATAVPVPSKYDFPSAASIPPVSIMTAEPSAPPEAKPAPAAAPRRTQHAAAPLPRPRAAPARAPAPPPPPQIAPAPTAASSAPSAPALH
jgi:hypothetical protein